MPGWSHTFSGSIQCSSGCLLLSEASVTLIDGNRTLANASLSSSFRISKWSINASLTPDSKPFYRFSNICNFNDDFQQDVTEENGRPKDIFIVVSDSRQQPIKISGFFNCSLGPPFRDGMASFGASCFDSEGPPKRLEMSIKTETITPMLARYTLFIPAPYWSKISIKIKESETPCFIFIQNACAKNDSAVAPIKLVNDKPVIDQITVDAIPSPGPYLDCVKLLIKKPGLTPTKDVFEHLKKNKTKKNPALQYLD